MIHANKEISEQALLREFGVPVNDETRLMLTILGGLASHDLSAMREALGMLLAVSGAVLKTPVWTAIFQYDGFPVVYESGISDVTTWNTKHKTQTLNAHKQITKPSNKNKNSQANETLKNCAINAYINASTPFQFISNPTPMCLHSPYIE